MKTIKQSSFFVLLLFAVTGCFEDFAIRGNGVELTETRAVSSFNKVKSSGDFQVQITKGEGSEVVVNAEENIMPYIETSVHDNTLYIDITGIHNVKHRLPMNVYITVPELSEINQSGSGTITTDYFTTENMDLFISGSGSITTVVDAVEVNASISGSGWIIVSGDSGQSNMTISGSGNIDGSNLLVNNCIATISGSGNMQVNARRTINARISGSGNIYYYGNPGIETSISGSGKVLSAN